jgi:hypothetical protein
MSSEPGVEEYTRLGAQLPPVPPDEVPGLMSLRDLSADEEAQYEADAALIRAIAPLAPYTRAAEAVRALGDIVDGLEAEPSGGARKRLAKALRAAAHALRLLPGALASKLPGDEAFALAVADLEADGPFREALAIDETAPAELSREAAERCCALACDAVHAGAVLAARWLLAQRAAIDAASRRIARLGGEVIEGVPVVVTFRTRRRDSGDIDRLGLTPDFLPLREIQDLQSALRRAEDLLADKPPQPSTRGASAMYDEQVAATLGISDEGAEDEDESAPPEAAARALDLAALVAHLGGGSVRLEQAWSRALEDEDVATLTGEWISLMQAIAGQVAYDDRELTDEQARFELPIAEDDLLAMPLDGGPAASRAAEAIAMSWLADGVSALQRPTNIAPDLTGRRVAFFSSGAFMRVRNQLTLLSALSSDAPMERALTLVRRAGLHGDPEAVVLHAATLLRWRGDVTGRVPRRIIEVADRLVAGEATDLATITVLADAALRLVNDT